MKPWVPRYGLVEGRTSWVISSHDRGGSDYLVRPTRWGCKPIRFPTRRACLKHIATMLRGGNHPTQRLRYEGKLVDVDKMMVDIVKATWRLGLRTLQCCQNNPPYDLSGRRRRGRWHLLTLPSQDAVRWMRIVRYGKDAYGNDDFDCWSFNAHWAGDSFPAHPNDFGIRINFRWSERARVLQALRKESRRR